MDAGIPEDAQIRAVTDGLVRVTFAAAILHTIDLDSLAKLMDRLASPQALFDGLPVSALPDRAAWAEMVNAARFLRDSSTFDADVIAEAERRVAIALAAPPA